LVDADGGILADNRSLLAVKTGERGLRQSEAFFQHVECLPSLTESILERYRDDICAVAVSDRPRPIEASYMPVFTAGVRFAQMAAQALGKPLFRFSHQEGHIRAGGYGTDPGTGSKFLAWHMSGGTSELLLVKDGGRGAAPEGGRVEERGRDRGLPRDAEAADGERRSHSCLDIEIVGGSLDISFGQLIDRIGVAIGYGFPAGARMDMAALAAEDRMAADGSPAPGQDGGAEFRAGKRGGSFAPGMLSPISIKGLYCNMSGIETQALRHISSYKDNSGGRSADGGANEYGGRPVDDSVDNGVNEYSGRSADGGANKFGGLILEVFSRVTAALKLISDRAAGEYDVDSVLFTGGVAASAYLRRNLLLENARTIFGDAKLSGDNAVGIALLGAESLNGRMIYGNQAD
jgi:N6-L-threonylcarbamoyladenine synthase